MQHVCVAVDVNGGDFGSRTIIEGVVDALGDNAPECRIYLCGNREEIISTVESCNGKSYLDNETIVVEDCSYDISERDIPAMIWKTKADSSVVRCIALQKEKKVGVSLSACDTRIIIAASVFLLGRIKGVPRPALGVFMPTVNKRPCLLLDVGANITCRTEHLVGFGVIGYQYTKEIFGIENPRVMLLNIGVEATKGTKVIIDASRILAKKCKGYGGFIEGSRIFSGEADVIVCDGFVGNVLLKACESIIHLSQTVLQDDALLMQILKERMAVLNSENYGAVPLLGLNGVVFKAHGSSSKTAIRFAVTTALAAAATLAGSKGSKR